MKKRYIKPGIKAIVLDTPQLLAGSGPFENNKRVSDEYVGPVEEGVDNEDVATDAFQW
jgi:hypothetical protein